MPETPYFLHISVNICGMPVIFLEAADHYWKVARIVRGAADKCTGSTENIPYVFYVDRIRKLVEKGIVESEGDIRYMRFSEVRKVKK